MTTIPVTVDSVTGALAPSAPIPADAIAIVCDGANYTVYQPGDTVPALPGMPS